MDSKTINFTKTALANLSIPVAGKREYYKDAQLKGLILDVRSNGSKSFYVYKKIKGKPERIFIGKSPDLSVEKARKLAVIKIAQIAEGKNPQDELRLIRNEMTLKQLYEEYMERYSKIHKKSWRYDEREIPKFLSKWFKRKISDIKKTDIQQLDETIFKENGLYQANRILERVRGLFNKAKEWGWEGPNPTIGIKKFKEKSRDRFIQPNELPFVIRAINEEENETIKDYLWGLLLTGMRKTNMLMMRWEEINWDRCIWRIPDSKNGDPIIVALSSHFIEILKRRYNNSTSSWVFPSKDDNQNHMVNITRGWQRIKEKASMYCWLQDNKVKEWLEPIVQTLPVFYNSGTGFKAIIKKAAIDKINLPPSLMDIRLHDMRRTFGSYQAITGASLQIIGKSLGHKSIHATQIYARLNLDPVREAIEKATTAMLISS